MEIIDPSQTFQDLYRIFSKHFDPLSAQIYFNLNSNLRSKKLKHITILMITPDTDTLAFPPDSRIKEIIFLNGVRQMIPLPKSVERVVITTRFHHSIHKFHFPPYLTHLTFGPELNEDMDADNLPESLTHLACGESFNQPVNNLPSNLKCLTLGEAFNQPINNLPPTLTHLTLGSTFNNSLGSLPKTLTYLSCGGPYYGCLLGLTGAFPNSLLHLDLGNYPSALIDSLPTSLTYLSYNPRFCIINHLWFNLRISLQFKEAINLQRIDVVLNSTPAYETFVHETFAHKAFVSPGRKALRFPSQPDSLTLWGILWRSWYNGWHHHPFNLWQEFSF